MQDLIAVERTVNLNLIAAQKSSLEEFVSRSFWPSFNGSVLVCQESFVRMGSCDVSTKLQIENVFSSALTEYSVPVNNLQYSKDYYNPPKEALT